MTIGELRAHLHELKELENQRYDHQNTYYDLPKSPKSKEALQLWDDWEAKNNFLERAILLISDLEISNG